MHRLRSYGLIPVLFFLPLISLPQTPAGFSKNKVVNLEKPGERHKDTLIISENWIFTTANSRTRWIDLENPPPGFLRIDWIYPSEGTVEPQGDIVRIKLAVISSSPVHGEGIRLYINGQKKTSKFSEVSIVGSAYEMTYQNSVRVAEIDQAVVVEVVNKTGSKERSSPLRIKGENASRESSHLRPNLHLLSVGPKLDLDYTENDARDFARLFQQQDQLNGGLFKIIETTILTGKSANTLNIANALSSLKWQVARDSIKENDLIILFFSSHGFITPDGQFRIQGNDFNANNIPFTSLSYQRDILENLAALPGKKIVFIDACHSGVPGAKMNPKSRQINEAIRQLNQYKEGLCVIASSREEEESFEDYLWQNGAFTEAIVKGLESGHADRDRSGIITLNELYDYLLAIVPAMVKKVKNRSQTPFLVSNGLGNLPFYVTEKSEP